MVFGNWQEATLNAEYSICINSITAKNGTGGADTFERAPGRLDTCGHHTGILPEYEHQSKCTAAQMAWDAGVAAC